MTIEHFRPALDAKGIEVEFERNAGDESLFDPDYLEQILGNLLSNVEKYVPTGGKARVSTEQNSMSITVSVADDGPGIPAGQRDAVFQPFTRLSDRLSDGITGTGIGLTISRDLARNHGGELSLESDGEGAVFRMTMAATN